MSSFATRFGTPLLLVLGVVLVGVAWVFAPAALKIVDEAIYYAAALAMEERGSLIVENGWEQFGAEALQVQFMTAGPNGLTPHYPPGAAILGAPLLSLFGMRGLMLLNALAAAATLFATRALGRAAFGREDVALAAALILAFATYLAEYAFGVWPHALSTLLVTCSLWALMRGLAGDAGRVPGWAAVSGLAAGAGILVRVDTVLLLPVLAAAAILFAPRPWVTLGAGLAGLLPGLAAGAAINQFKFGTWNPISYGAAEGGIAIATHLPAIGLLAALFALIVLRRARPGLLPARTGWLLLVGALVAIAVVPGLRHLAFAYARGFWGLVVDIGIVGGPKITDSGQVRYFWNLPKKGLGQSLPWIGALAALVLLPVAGRARRSIVLLAAAVFVWTLPFILMSWQGGYTMNMRYFLPILPALAVLGGWLWFYLADRTGAGYSVFILGTIYAVVIMAAWILYGPSEFDGVQQVLSTDILIGAAGLSLIGVWAMRFSPRFGIAPQFMLAIGFCMSAALTAIDIRVDFWARNLVARAAYSFESMPEPSLYFGRPELVPFQFERAGGLVAMPTGLDDYKLIEDTLDAGYRVFLEPEQLPRFLHDIEDLEPLSKVYSYSQFVFVEVRRRPASAPAPDPEQPAEAPLPGSP